MPQQSADTSCPVWEGIKGGGGSCGVQFPDALKDLLLCHLFHTEWGVPIDGVRDECWCPLENGFSLMRMVL